MTTCQHTPQVHAYHDGQLPAPARAAVEEHLRQCPTCTAELAWLDESRQTLRGGLKMAAPAGLAQAVSKYVRKEPDRPALRLAGWLTAAAAAIVVVCLPQVRFSANEPARAEAPPTWETAAVAPLAEQTAAAGDEMQLAQWMVDDLRSNRGDQ